MAILSTLTITIDGNVLAVLVAAAIGFLGWMTRMAYLQGQIRADVRVRIKAAEMAIADHERRLRIVEARPQHGGIGS